MTTIELKDEQLATVVATSILQSLTEENRNELITNAIRGLLASQKGAYGSQSEIQHIFSTAAGRVATKMLEEELAGNAEFIGKVRALMSEALERTFVEPARTKLLDALSSSVQRALYGQNY